MNKPKKPSPPSPYNYHLQYTFDSGRGFVITGCDESVNETLFFDREKHWDDPTPDCYECEDEGCEECEEERSLNKKSLNNMSLQDLIDILPPGVEPKDTSFVLQAGDSGCNFCAEFQMLYAKKLDSNKCLASYDKDLKKYKDRLLKFPEKEKEYKEWKRNQDIAKEKAKLIKTKAKLAKLESK
jgi:hypothetical protein